MRVKELPKKRNLSALQRRLWFVVEQLDKLIQRDVTDVEEVCRLCAVFVQGANIYLKTLESHANEQLEDILARLTQLESGTTADDR